MKRKSILVIFVCLVVLFSGCSINKKGDSDNNTKKTIKLTTSNMPNSIPFFYMQENDVLGENIKLEISIHKTGQEAIAKIVKNEVDMALFGVQEAAKLYNKEINVRLINVSTWSNFELLTTRNDINSWSDLIGKNLWLGDKGGPIDYLTQIVLREKGIDINDIEVSRIRTAELAQMAVNDIKDMDAFILREPFVSQVKVKNGKVHSVFDIGEEYHEGFKVKAPQSGVVGTDKFIESSAEILKLFQTEYEKAIKWVQQHPKEASEIGSKYLSGFQAQVLLKAIENTDMELVEIHNAKQPLEKYYKLSIQIDPVVLENKLPDEKFYTEIGTR